MPNSAAARRDFRVIVSLPSGTSPVGKEKRGGHEGGRPLTILTSESRPSQPFPRVAFATKAVFVRRSRSHYFAAEELPPRAFHGDDPDCVLPVVPVAPANRSSLKLASLVDDLNLFCGIFPSRNAPWGGAWPVARMHGPAGEGGGVPYGPTAPAAAPTSASTAVRIWSGRCDHAAMTRARSGSGATEQSAPEFAPLCGAPCGFPW